MISWCRAVGTLNGTGGGGGWLGVEEVAGDEELRGQFVLWVIHESTEIIHGDGSTRG